MTDPRGGSETKHQHRGILFHLWLILRLPFRKFGAKKKRKFLEGVRFFGNRPDGKTSLDAPASAPRLDKLGFLLRKPKPERTFSSFRKLFHALGRSLNARRSRMSPEKPGDYSPVTMSLKRAIETGKKGINEDAVIMGDFFRMVFRIKQKTAQPGSTTAGVKFIGARTKDPTPRTHPVSFFFRQPRETILQWTKSGVRFLVYCVRKWQPITVVILITFLSLEFSLQFVSTATWTFLSRKKAAGSQNGIVLAQSALFLGDFFTSGEFGSRDVKPYTEYLPELLAQRKISNWHIISFSSQHADTSTLLDVLPGLILKERPRIAYFMIGGDDLQGRTPDDVIESQEELTQNVLQDYLLIPTYFKRWQRDPAFSTIVDSFSHPSYYVRQFLAQIDNTFESSTPKLVALFRQTERPWSFQEGQTWFHQGEQVTWSGGRLVFQDGNTWNCSLPGRYCLMETDPKEIRLLERDDFDLFLTGETPGETIHLSQNNQAWDTNNVQSKQLEIAGWRSLQISSFERAQNQFQEALSFDSESPSAHAGLAEAFYFLGNYLGYNREIEWLKGKRNSDGGLLTARAFARAFVLERPPADRVKTLTDIVTQYPENPWLWANLADSLAGADDFPLASASIRKALLMVPDQLKSIRASFLRNQAKIQLRLDLKEASRSLIQAFLLDRDVEAFEKALRANGEFYHKVNFDQILDQLSLTKKEKAELSFVFRQAVDTKSMLRIALFKQKLSALLEICRSSRVEPILVSYPVAHSEIFEVVRLSAEQNNVSWLNLNSQFEILLSKENHKQQIYRYGVLTDEGSRRIAQMIASDLASRIVIPQHARGQQ